MLEYFKQVMQNILFEWHHLINYIFSYNGPQRKYAKSLK